MKYFKDFRTKNSKQTEFEQELLLLLCGQINSMFTSIHPSTFQNLLIHSKIWGLLEPIPATSGLNNQFITDQIGRQIYKIIIINLRYFENYN